MLRCVCKIILCIANLILLVFIIHFAFQIFKNENTSRVSAYREIFRNWLGSVSLRSENCPTTKITHEGLLCMAGLHHPDTLPAHINPRDKNSTYSVSMHALIPIWNQDCRPIQIIWSLFYIFSQDFNLIKQLKMHFLLIGDYE